MAIQPSYNAGKGQEPNKDVVVNERKAASAGPSTSLADSPSKYPTKWHEYNARVQVELGKVGAARLKMNEAQAELDAALNTIAHLNLPQGGL